MAKLWAGSMEAVCLSMVSSFVQNEFCLAQFSGMASSTFQEDLENTRNS